MKGQDRIKYYQTAESECIALIETLTKRVKAFSQKQQAGTQWCCELTDVRNGLKEMIAHFEDWEN